MHYYSHSEHNPKKHIQETFVCKEQLKCIKPRCITHDATRPCCGVEIQIYCISALDLFHGY